VPEGSPVLRRVAAVLRAITNEPLMRGRSKHWVKVKNRTHPAMYRVMDELA
jgi:hypothetical protein